MRHQQMALDALLSDFFGDSKRGAAASSEKRLMLAVLRNALECYQKHLHATDRTGRELFAEAAAWIESTNGHGLFSFENISEALELEPQYVRRQLARWKQSQLDPRR
ncbi:hypothetical protein KF840_19860 [bacterium]|nr:hypothetical protein [bacterium]